MLPSFLSIPNAPTTCEYKDRHVLRELHQINFTLPQSHSFNNIVHVPVFNVFKSPMNTVQVLVLQLKRELADSYFEIRLQKIDL